MGRAERTKSRMSESPESMVTPYEDLGSRQLKLTGESLPGLPMGLCDRCHWCYSLLNARGTVKSCPMCGAEVSLVPMKIDEICELELNEKRGITLKFRRKLPMR